MIIDLLALYAIIAAGVAVGSYVLWNDAHLKDRPRYARAFLLSPAWPLIPLLALLPKLGEIVRDARWRRG